MSSRWELDDGIKSIKSAWQREHTARSNLEKMLQNAEAENAKLRELVRDLWEFGCGPNSGANSAAEWAEIADALHDRMTELGVSAHD